MSQLASENAMKFLMLAIWKLRKHLPNLQVEITNDDMASLSLALYQNGKTPTLAFKGKANSVEIQIVDADSGKLLLLADGNPNAPNAVMQQKCMDARTAQLPQKLANRLRHHADLGKLDKALAYEAAEMIDLLTWEPS